MGKDYTPLRLNNLDEEKPIKKLYKKDRVVEASDESYFNKLPPRSAISEIEVGSAGTKETIFRLKDGGFVVVKGTVSNKSLVRKDMNNPTGGDIKEYEQVTKTNPKEPKYLRNPCPVCGQEAIGVHYHQTPKGRSVVDYGAKSKAKKKMRRIS